jgi:hypothetical protein
VSSLCWRGLHLQSDCKTFPKIQNPKNIYKLIINKNSILGDHDDSKETLLNFHEFNPRSRLDSRMLLLPESCSRTAFLVSSPARIVLANSISCVVARRELNCSRGMGVAWSNPIRAFYRSPVNQHIQNNYSLTNSHSQNPNSLIISHLQNQNCITNCHLQSKLLYKLRLINWALLWFNSPT